MWSCATYREFWPLGSCFDCPSCDFQFKGSLEASGMTCSNGSGRICLMKGRSYAPMSNRQAAVPVAMQPIAQGSFLGRIVYRPIRYPFIPRCQSAHKAVLYSASAVVICPR